MQANIITAIINIIKLILLRQSEQKDQISDKIGECESENNKELKIHLPAATIFSTDRTT